MRNLLEFLAKYNHWFLFVILEAISLVLLFQYNSYQGSIWFSSANAISGKIYEIDSSIETFFSLNKRNQLLTQRNLYLEQQVRTLSEQLLYKTKDSIAIQASKKQFVDYKLIPAKVISNSVSKHDNFITIDKGTNDGVKKDMGVVSGNGVVGIVYLSSPHYALIIPVLNSESNISCAIENRGYFGYLHWTGGLADMAYVDDIPRHARFKLGEKVVTSGYSAVFPPGVMVGTIKHVFNSADGLSYRLQIKLSTDFGNLRDVCVIDNTDIKKKLNILRATEDSIKSKNE